MSGEVKVLLYGVAVGLVLDAMRKRQPAPAPEMPVRGDLSTLKLDADGYPIRSFNPADAVDAEFIEVKL